MSRENEKPKATFESFWKSLRQFADHLSHEVNNPLSFITTNIDWMRDEIKNSDSATKAEPSEVLDVLSEIEEGSLRIRKIISELAVFSEIWTERSGQANLSHAAKIAFRGIEGGTRLSAKIDTKLRVHASEAQIQTLLRLCYENLIVFRKDTDPSLVNLEVEPELTVVNIDLYVGERPDSQSKEGGGFEPNFAARSAARSGLGLYLPHLIASSLGGTLQVKVEGTSVSLTLRLPRWKKRERAEPRDTERVPAKSARVLIVDDEPLMRRALKRILNEYDVHVADCGEAAFLLCQNQEFDAIICDVVMAGMSGIDFHRKLGELNPAQLDRFIFMTGGARDRECRSFFADGAHLLLEKPVTRQQILGVIAATVSKT